MGKIRSVKLGDEEGEKEQKRRAEARRQTKQSKKGKLEGTGLHGGERVAVVEGTDIKPEYKKLVDEVETEEATGKKHKKEKKVEVKAHTHSKRYLEIIKLVDKTKLYPLTEAVELVKKTSLSKYDGTVELHINVNPNTLDSGKTDIRGTVTLPHGTGKEIRVIEATDAVIAEVEAGKINFDVLVARPSIMPKLAKVARVLGPKGLMPNPKNGTVTEDIEKRIIALSKGQINYKSEPENPIIHMAVGKVSFSADKLTDNINSVLDNIGRGKISKATIAASVGPGIKITI
jgi:large subunit ribosomal protein L1